MGYYVKHGHRFLKRTKNRRLNTIDAILGTKKMAKIYSSERDAKKAITTQEHQYPELKGKLLIVQTKEAPTPPRSRNPRIPYDQRNLNTETKEY